MEKNKLLSALSRKKDFDFLKNSAENFSFQWLKAFFFYKKGEKGISLAWGLPKNYISQAVLRNRLKRWGRENLKKSDFKGLLFILFLKQDKNFYKNMKRTDFDATFKKLLQTLDKKTKKSP